MKTYGRVKSVGQACATALVAVGLVLAVTYAAVAANQTSSPVDPTPEFSISSTISSSPISQVAALLYPGEQRYLWYTVYNPQEVPITINSMSISGLFAPTGCPITNLNDSLTTYSGSLVIPPGHTNAVSVPISLYDTPSNQDACEGVTFTFTFTGSATYVEAYDTVTDVVSSLNPSPAGEAVTYTATITAGAAVGQDPVPSSPTGTVSFLDGASAICSTVPVASATVETGTATCSPPAYAGAATHDITAVYTDSDGNFTDSTSTTLSQVVTP